MRRAGFSATTRQGIKNTSSPAGNVGERARRRDPQRGVPIRAVGAVDPVPPQRRSLRSPELHRRPEPEITKKKSRNSMRDIHGMPGHLARRFQQIAVAAFLAEVEEAGYDLTPVQCAALAAVGANPRIDQVTLAGLIAFDRTTITGVVDRLAQKGTRGVARKQPRQEGA